MHDAGQKLFSEGDLADYLDERLERLLARLKPARRRQPPDVLKPRIAALEAKHRVELPVILKGLKIVDQGPVADERPRGQFDLAEPIDPGQFDNRRGFLQARIRFLEAFLKHASPRRYVVIEVPFAGDASLFRYRPSQCRLPAPDGVVAGSAIRLQFERSGKHDHGWQVQLKEELLRIETFLLRIRREVAAYNATVRKAIRAAMQPPPVRSPKRQC